MSLSKSLAAAGLALGMVAATASGAFAYSVAWAGHNAPVKANPSFGSATVNWIHDGQQVTVLGCYSNNWCKIKIPGQDGFVKKASLDFGWNGNGWNGNGWNGNGWNGNGWNNGNDVHGQACFTGNHGYFCIGG